jgi:hypothetical protein
MEKIIYFNLSNRTNWNIYTRDNSEVYIVDLFNNFKNDTVFIQEYLPVLNGIDLESIDPLGLNKPKKWETVVAALIYCISGIIPRREDVLIGRQILFELDKDIKKNRKLMQKISFCLMPYILICFKVHLGSKFQQDSNNIKTVVNFVETVVSEKITSLSSLLCTHRGNPLITGKHSLIQSLEADKIIKVLNIQKALLSNSHHTCTPIDWYQQFPTEFISLNMLPDMFFNYLEKKDISELFRLVEKHKIQMELIFNNVSQNSGVLASINSLDYFIIQAINFMNNKYGFFWRSIDFSSKEYLNDKLVSVALNETLESISRHMIFHDNCNLQKKLVTDIQLLAKENLYKNFKIDVKNQILIAKSIDNFILEQSATISARAMYETVFYYTWGEYCAKKRVLAVGIDRDHAPYQINSWNSGFFMSNQVKNNLLYARRSDHSENPTLLKYYNIRQFWR